MFSIRNGPRYSTNNLLHKSEGVIVVPFIQGQPLPLVPDLGKNSTATLSVKSGNPSHLSKPNPTYSNTEQSVSATDTHMIAIPLYHIVALDLRALRNAIFQR